MTSQGIKRRTFSKLLGTIVVSIADRSVAVSSLHVVTVEVYP
jgi:hypothetical protein